MKTKYLAILLSLLSMLFFVGCSSTPEPNFEATIAAGVAATQTAAPTATPEPTDTPEPANTPEPTDTPAPTDTPEPTNTPTTEPTDTPEPTDSSSSSNEGTELENGDMLYTLSDEGFSISLSPDWEVVDLEKLNMGEILGELGRQNEGLEDLFSSGFLQNLIASGMKFYALNLSDASLDSATPATINVLKQDLPIEPTLGEYVNLTISQLERVFDLKAEIEQEDIKIGDNDAVKLSYVINIADTFGQNVEASTTQIFLLDGSIIYIITLSMPVELADDYLEPFLEEVKSFRILK